jgi:hypothetical protein
MKDLRCAISDLSKALDQVLHIANEWAAG